MIRRFKDGKHEFLIRKCYNEVTEEYLPYSEIIKVKDKNSYVYKMFYSGHWYLADEEDYKLLNIEELIFQWDV